MPLASPMRALGTRSASSDMAEGVSADSPTPINARGMASEMNPRAAPDAAVSRLHSAMAPAISRGRWVRSASTPMNSPATA